MNFLKFSFAVILTQLTEWQIYIIIDGQLNYFQKEMNTGIKGEKCRNSNAKKRKDKEELKFN